MPIIRNSFLKSDSLSKINFLKSNSNKKITFNKKPRGSIYEEDPYYDKVALLLDFESELKIGVDQGLVVWCEPLGDKSTLRNLRGIEIRTERLTEPHR